MKARWRHTRRQATRERQRIHVDRDRAICVSTLERDAHETIGPLLESVLRERRTQHVTKERLAAFDVEQTETPPPELRAIHHRQPLYRCEDNPHRLRDRHLCSRLRRLLPDRRGARRTDCRLRPGDRSLSSRSAAIRTALTCCPAFAPSASASVRRF